VAEPRKTSSGADEPDDPLAALERALREHEAMPVAAGTPDAESADDRALRDLDRWLTSIVADRA
jgi:hypothetical protein